MKILLNNLILNASLTATDEDESYPVSRVKDRFLEYRFKSVVTSSTITASWATNQTVSCIAIGYHNATSGTYTLKDSGGSTVGSGSLEVDYDTCMTYFTAVSTVRSIEITLTSTSVLYLGGLGCGDPLEIEYHNVNPRFDYINKDSATFLDGGQALGKLTKNRIVRNVTVGSLTEAQFLSIMDGLDMVGNSFPVYFDLYDTSHSRLKRPIHGILIGDGQFNRDSRSNDYSTRLICSEAR